MLKLLVFLPLFFSCQLSSVHCFDEISPLALLNEHVSHVYSSKEARVNNFRKAAAEQRGVFGLPNELPHDEALRQYRKRQQLVKLDVLRIETKQSLQNVFLFAEAGIKFDFHSTVQPVLDGLLTEQDPDFNIIQLVRLMQYTAEYNHLILPVLRKLPLWMNHGEKLRVYWSENHMIMYSSSAWLLREMFGQNFTQPEDKTLRERLEWFLRVKASHGYYEFYSHTYMRFTLSALLNLYDFSKDKEIVHLSEKALTNLIKEWMQCLNTDGFCFAVSGRTTPVNYLIDGIAYGSTAQENMALLTGLGPLVVPNEELTFATYFLAQSSFDPYEATKTFQRVGYKKRKIGHSYHDGQAIFHNLSYVYDRYTAQMSAGGYAHPDYVADTFRNINHFSMWSHKFFNSYSSARNLPRIILQTLLKIASTVSRGSIVDVHLHLYKHEGVTLSSCENYYPGFKGYQQMTWMAATGDLATFTISIDSSIYSSTSRIDNEKMNNQLPYVEQDNNVALIMYNPNKDLSILGVEVREVLFHFDVKYFDEVVDLQVANTHTIVSSKLANSTFSNKWIFGKRYESYIGVYRHCVDSLNNSMVNGDEVLRICPDDKQIWAVVVGNNYTHKTFTEFISQVLTTSRIKTELTDDKCISGDIYIDGKHIQHKFCRRLGRVIVSIILLITFFIILSVTLFICCRKRRRVWKKVVSYTCPKSVALIYAGGDLVFKKSKVVVYTMPAQTIDKIVCKFSSADSKKQNSDCHISEPEAECDDQVPDDEINDTYDDTDVRPRTRVSSIEIVRNLFRKRAVTTGQVKCDIKMFENEDDNADINAEKNNKNNKNNDYKKTMESQKYSL